MKAFFSPKGFLLWGGIILVALAVLGSIGILGNSVERSVLGSFFWLDDTENILHLLFGVVALAAYFLLKEENLQKWLVALVGVVALVAALVGFMNAGNTVDNTNIFSLASTNLENPSDNILHLIVALWAGLVVYKSVMTKA
jgi:hypothetical protein